MIERNVPLALLLAVTVCGSSWPASTLAATNGARQNRSASGKRLPRRQPRRDPGVRRGALEPAANRARAEVLPVPAGGDVSKTTNARIGESLRALEAGQIGEARDLALRLLDHPAAATNYRTWLVLARTTYALAMANFEGHQLARAREYAEVCLEHLRREQASKESNDPIDTDAKIMCSAIAAVGYHREGRLSAAFKMALACATTSHTHVDPTIENHRVECEQVMRAVEDVDYGLHSTDWARSAVISVRGGYGVRFVSDSVAGGGARFGGFMGEIAAGVPTMEFGPVLIRPELAFLWGTLSREDAYIGQSTLDAILKEVRTIDRLSLYGGGIRLNLQLPMKSMAVEVALGITLSGLSLKGVDLINVEPAGPLVPSWEAILRVVTRENRLTRNVGLAFGFSLGFTGTMMDSFRIKLGSGTEIGMGGVNVSAELRLRFGWSPR